ncbi:type I restriction-modification system subunit M [Vibrio alginolyticus]|uniref:type I restriction-modification system subunit M n=1 Tax=Vibrio alginolyticus TaxID=663 RepID=UPI00215BA085|nr:type I restriction-modification system subunit M [Vibrio alginolyticus]ELA7326698.1 type I restriction-modification system subunit M [Vibrio alginolyticus]MCR9372476.1 type I restriction-modification system subunit M [Vibrio alginolyticus]MCR9407579.1 type I restriction-modification system subunit M [Vibrio alginolyticus]
MAIKKTELYSSLWASCDELRGGMDASQYKDYVLTMLFMKYVSDKYKGDPYGMIVVPEGASFDDLVAIKNDKEIGDKINKIIASLAEENDLKGVIDVADFNDEDKLGKGKEMVDRLTKLVGIFQRLDLSDNRADGDDLLGDAYEYLMRHFATESGKSKGQFYTPSEVSRILAKVVGITKDTPQDATVYDPTCGSGSLLLKASDEAPRGLSIFGQEMDNATSALARMNMILHNNETAKIVKGNTLSSPEWKDAPDRLKAFDFSVANPPFSNKNWTSGIVPTKDTFKRFKDWGVPPEKNGDYAFLLHIISSLKSTGKGAVILPHGVLFRGNAEKDIRENLIKQGYIKGIIGLPANLFYGTGIPACIIVVDKEHSQKAVANADGKLEGRSIFMIDASKGFMKDGNKNRLRSQDIHKIVDVFNKQAQLERYSRMVPVEEITSNDYNLNIPRYIDSSEPEDLHDLSAHLQGGIPNRDIDALDNYWTVFPSIRETLFKAAREGYSEALVEAGNVKATILAHQEFKDFKARSLLPFKAWAKQASLTEISIGDSPKELIYEISENLLAGYANSELLSKYDIYQILMDYWADVMQDDVYVLAQDGWEAGKVLRELVVAKGEKLKEIPDLTIAKKKYKAELIPPSVIVARYFADKQTEIDELQAKLDAATQLLESYIEEQSVEDGLLAEAFNDKDKITKASVAARAKLATDVDEIAALTRATKLFNAESTAKKAVKTAQESLDLAVFNQYPELSLDEVKSLIVEDKWLAVLKNSIVAEIERVTQRMANRVKQLEERYSTPLPVLEHQVDSISDKVANHLKAMGLEWNL